MVPALVPSVTHSSLALLPNEVWKKARFPTAPMSCGCDDGGGSARRFTASDVPSGVPSLDHSSHPCRPSQALKYVLPASVGNAPLLPAYVSVIVRVPSSVASLTQARGPLPSSATHQRRPFDTASAAGLLLFAPGAMSFSRYVPAAVP